MQSIIGLSFLAKMTALVQNLSLSFLVSPKMEENINSELVQINQLKRTNITAVNRKVDFFSFILFYGFRNALKSRDHRDVCAIRGLWRRDKGASNFSAINTYTRFHVRAADLTLKRMRSKIRERSRKYWP